MTAAMNLMRAVALLLAAASSHAAAVLQEGDIIFHTSRSSQSIAIQSATKSPYSHMGVVLSHNGKLAVFEASATVRYTPVSDWIKRGEGGRYVVKRVRGGLSSSQQVALRASAQAFDGKPYDPTFEWSDSRIYCSELVWKMYKRALGLEIGRLQTLKDFDLTSKAVKEKMKQRYGADVPLEETVISPVAMLESKNLQTVHTGT